MGCGASAPEGQHAPPGVTMVQSKSAMKPIAESEFQQNTFRVRSSMDLTKQGMSDPSRTLTKTSSLRAGASPAEVLQSLLDGNERFLEGTSERPHQDFERLAQLADGQNPHAAILGCADSRVPPEIMFDQGFGDVFVCRVAGNIATAEEVASLEYGVLELGVKVVMVLGHTHCGAVKAALSGKAFPGFIDTLVDHLDVAVARVDGMTHAELQGAREGKQDMIDRVVEENVKYQVERCKRSTILCEAINKGKLILVGAVYSLDDGHVRVLPPRKNRGIQQARPSGVTVVSAGH